MKTSERALHSIREENPRSPADDGSQRRVIAYPVGVGQLANLAGRQHGPVAEQARPEKVEVARGPQNGNRDSQPPDGFADDPCHGAYEVIPAVSSRLSVMDLKGAVRALGHLHEVSH